VSFPKPYADAVAKLRVLFGFVMVALGLALRAWASGHLEKNLALATRGPYARVRNPLYLGTLVAAAGLAIAARAWELAALFAAVFALVYLPVVELEEQHLRELFLEFEEYSHRVPRLIPRLRARREERQKPFRWELYRRNREYEALAGFLAGVVVLVWKILRNE
jgi:protein-S-isoprenylcysteine O-methyltransferase Ste14